MDGWKVTSRWTRRFYRGGSKLDMWNPGSSSRRRQAPRKGVSPRRRSQTSHWTVWRAVLTERFGSTATSTKRFRVRLVRYADDFIITGRSKELLEKEVKPCVEAFLAERGLQLSQEKTKITHISEGFDFLGQNVRKYDGKLLIKPSAKNVKAFLDSVRETIRVNRSAKQETLIDLLNPMIRGWANYHRHVVAKKTYAAVDHHIWRALWRWARRRHPNKSCRWVRQKYFRTLGHRHWVFATKPEGTTANRECWRCFQPQTLGSSGTSELNRTLTHSIRLGTLTSRSAKALADVGAAAGPRLPKTTLAAATRQMPGMRSTHRRRRSMGDSTRCPTQGRWHSLAHQLETAALYLPTSLPHRQR